MDIIQIIFILFIAYDLLFFLAFNIYEVAHAPKVTAHFEYLHLLLSFLL